jgi:hypothetical protein
MSTLYPASPYQIIKVRMGGSNYGSTVKFGWYWRTSGRFTDRSKGQPSGGRLLIAMGQGFRSTPSG